MSPIVVAGSMSPIFFAGKPKSPTAIAASHSPQNRPITPISKRPFALSMSPIFFAGKPFSPTAIAASHGPNNRPITPISNRPFAPLMSPMFPQNRPGTPNSKLPSARSMSLISAVGKHFSPTAVAGKPFSPTAASLSPNSKSPITPPIFIAATPKPLSSPLQPLHCSNNLDNIINSLVPNAKNPYGLGFSFEFARRFLIEIVDHLLENPANYFLVQSVEDMIQAYEEEFVPLDRKLGNLRYPEDKEKYADFKKEWDQLKKLRDGKLKEIINALILDLKAAMRSSVTKAVVDE